MNVATDRVGILTDQLSESRALSFARLDGLTDEEYVWEPVPGMWSIRPRGAARTPDAFGPGAWVNREFIHHLAEVALLRDLDARRDDLAPSSA